MSDKRKKSPTKAGKKKLTSSPVKPKKPKRRTKATSLAQATVDELDIVKRIGENIKRIREAKGWVQEDMSDFGHAWRHYQRIEKGKRNLTLLVLIRLAKALGVDISDLTKP
jgi:ribosome-binding protein aMBF1 (putative translation factor)